MRYGQVWIVDDPPPSDPWKLQLQEKTEPPRIATPCSAPMPTSVTPLRPKTGIDGADWSASSGMPRFPLPFWPQPKSRPSESR